GQQKKWGGCWGGLPCFRVQKTSKRIVPASRAPDGNTASNLPNGAQGVANQATSLPPHLLAPPSSPASFSNSALPSTAPSPNCHLSLSANSPGGPSSTMYATGPYAHETQLVTPPVFSTYTTEPSTAPLTPPPELAHLTTPSSPDVPFAQFLSSSADLKRGGKISYMGSSDLQATYPYSPGSPASCLRSPVSQTPRACASPWDSSHSPKTTNGSKSHDSNFFCPATFAQFYLDQPHSVGRLSVSKDSDVHTNGGTVNQSKQSKTNKHDVEEVEAYRASFGFSADEMIVTAQYVDISDVMDDSFSINPCTSTEPQSEETALLGWGHGGSRSRKSGSSSPAENYTKSRSNISHINLQRTSSSIPSEDERHGNISSQSTPRNLVLTDDEDIFSGIGKSRKNRKFQKGQSCSDAEIEYRRGRSLRECRGDFSWH
ncbi:hypothetical protein KSS87_016503, partial [Heliosperma pusillum]